MLVLREKELCGEIYNDEARLAEVQDTDLRRLPKTADYGLLSVIIQDMQC